MHPYSTSTFTNSKPPDLSGFSLEFSFLVPARWQFGGHDAFKVGLQRVAVGQGDALHPLEHGDHCLHGALLFGNWWFSMVGKWRG